VVRLKAATTRQFWLIAGAILAVVLAGGYFLVDKAWRSNHAPSASTVVIGDKSIAVLPFTDMSEKKDQEYFADGMAEEIIDLLLKIPGLKVIGRTSSFQFKGRNADLRSIAAQLGVAYVLQGSVRKSADRLRVTVQLLNSRDGTQLLSRSYDQDMSDVLKMQDEIAVQVVRALQIEVTASDFVSRPVLRDTEAYTEYLKGLHAFNLYDQQGFEQAVSDFQRALYLAPSFAGARVWLAITYLCLEGFGFMPPASPSSRPIILQSWHSNWTRSLQERTRRSAKFISTTIGIGLPPTGS
jgi:TolB-like protein